MKHPAPTRLPGIHRAPARGGFSLIEVVLALGVIAFALVPLLGLLPSGLNDNRNATAQTAAANLVTAIAADVRTPTSTGSSSRYSINTAASDTQTLFFDDSGTLVSSLAGVSGYRASIKTTVVSDTQNLVQITVSWPGQAAATSAAGRLDAVVSVGLN